MKCQISNTCGSCQYIEENYDTQLLKKQDYCKKLFKDFNLNIHPVVGMEHPYEYRNKVIVAFNSKYEYGLYEEGSHRIVPMKECLLHDKETHAILKCIQILFKKYKVSIYDEKRNKGLVKYVLIRRAVETNQSLATLVVNESMFAGSKNFCNELIRKCPDVKTVVLNINKRQTSIVLSKEEKILYGKGFIVDQLCGMTFKISSQSFYQINHQQCTKLYQKVLELLDLDNESFVLDTYCGIGTIGMTIAPNVKKVVGVELNTQAYKDAINNAKMNHLDNMQFVNQDATEFMKKLAMNNETVDCVIMDPPRLGSTKEFVQSIKILKPHKVVYVSCDPSTQVRDLFYFKEIGYMCQDVFLYDMFPNTAHVESIVLLSHK